MSEGDAALAARIALEAWHLLDRLRETSGFEGKALGAAGDAEANRLILDALAAARPDDAVLSEEAADDPARLAARRVWIVDPLDGTREYAEGRDDWAVHIALAIDGAPAIGAVAAHGLVYASDPAPAVPAPAPACIVVSRSRAPAVAAGVAAALGADLHPMGSAGAKAMAVVRGEAIAYVHAGGQHEWDNCAPVAVALAAGLHASRLDGAPLVYNSGPGTLLPDLLIATPEAAAAILAILRDDP